VKTIKESIQDNQDLEDKIILWLRRYQNYNKGIEGDKEHDIGVCCDGIIDAMENWMVLSRGDKE
jgi:hypothetical protein